MGDSIKSFDCADATTREINQFLKTAAGHIPEIDVALLNPDCRHNLAVGIISRLAVQIAGHVGYYCCGLCDGIAATIDGDAGWGIAENLMSGCVALLGSAGAAAGATMRGGSLVIHGNAGARCGIAMKGGTLIVGGNVGYMSGFMMQKGVMVICGDAGDALGDSLYEGIIYLRGTALSMGSDVVETDMTDSDALKVSTLLDDAGIDACAGDFKKLVSGKRLYNFSVKEKELWAQAL